MERLPSIIPQLAFCLCFAILGTGCGEKQRIRLEIDDIRLKVNEKRTALKNSEVESAAVGNLGRYNTPVPQFFTELKAQVESQKKETIKLTEDRDLKAAAVKQAQDELVAYKAKFPPR